MVIIGCRVCWRINFFKKVVEWLALVKIISICFADRAPAFDNIVHQNSTLGCLESLVDNETYLLKQIAMNPVQCRRIPGFSVSAEECE